MNKQTSSIKIALVHDYLREYGGAERVLEALHKIFPQAPVYVAFKDDQSLGQQAQRFADWEIRETWLSKIPLFNKLYSPLRILAAPAFRKLDLNEFDVVISSSNAYLSKAVKVPNGFHICYCHTPPRAMYGYSSMSNWKKNPIIKFFGNIINHFMRIVDFNASRKVDFFLANSRVTQKRIKKFYKMDSTVINPPIKVPSLRPRAQNRDYYLYVNRLCLQKHPELAVKAFNELGLPLKIAGTGELLPDLRLMAQDNIDILGSVTDQKLEELYTHAKALIYPVEDEDFGMIPVEAMGYGVPILAHRSGGPTETIISGKTGLFFDKLNVDCVLKCVKKFQNMQFDSDFIHQHALAYNEDIFKEKIVRFINQNIKT